MTSKVVLTTAALLLLVLPLHAANNGASLYKNKCAGCHGADGAGKPGGKAPAIKGLDTNQIVQKIMQGDPSSKGHHKKAMSRITEEQAKEVAEYLKGLQ